MSEASETAPSLYESLRLLGEREDLGIFGSDAFALFAIETRFAIPDILGVATDILTEGDKDKKCDLLYVGREARTGVICQSYWAKGDKPNPPTNKAADLHTAASWVLNPVDTSSMGRQLLAARDELLDALANNDLDDLELWYVHNLSPFGDAGLELEQAATAAKSILATLGYGDINVRGLQVTPDKVDEWLRSSDGRVVIHDRITVPCAQWVPETGDGWKGVYTTVSAAWLRGLYTKYASERLFAGNIRGDMKPRRSQGDINNGIQRTITDNPGRLWAYNNGITALVEKLDTSGTELVIRGISIVNGAQTTGSIGRLSESSTKNPAARVLIRFVESADPAVVRDISTFNNTQNEILPSDFRSSDPTQARLVREFENTGIAVYWGPRRGGSGRGARRPSDLLDSDLVAQALAAFHGFPDTAYHAKNQIWRDNAIYDRFFSDKTTAAHVVFCVGLVHGVREYKMELRWLESRTGLQNKIHEFFSNRGSEFLMTFAIAGCIEEILSKAIVDKWKLSFGDTVSLEVAEEYWLPVVKALANYVDQLMPAARSGNLRDRKRVDSAASDFQSRVATGRVGVTALDAFVPFVMTG